MKIQDLITETKKVRWQDLKDLQPDNFKTKEHREKLKTSIKSGIISVLVVWIDPKDGITKTADGHQRISILYELVEEGYEVPEEISCAFLDNKIINTEKEAVKRLLKFNQKTEQITEEGLEKLLDTFDLNIKDIDLGFDDLDIKIEVEDLEMEEESDLSDKNKEVDIDNLDTQECKIVFKFDAMMYEGVLRRLNTIKQEEGLNTNEAVLFKLLENYGA